MTIRVLLADDQEMVRVGFRMILSGEPGIEVVGDACNGREAVDQAARLAPDIVLMDVRMPLLDGLAATAQILERTRTTRIIILTTFDDDAYVYEALSAGASGFMLKDAPAERLVDAVRVVAAGDGMLAPAVTRRVIDEVARHRRDPEQVRRVGTLSDREREVLRGMADGLTNAEIAARLFVGEATVKTHVGRVLQKLGARDRVQAVIAAYRSGFVHDQRGG
jgi:DNA-binding NarL/FixJ family response regulator